MTSLKSLSLKGIRCFKPNPENEDEQTIYFGNPITLIVGPNGAGKTTIIDSLSYAVTGGDNNSEKKSYFIQDPRISGGKTTQGEIQLAFTNRRNEEICIKRVNEASLNSTDPKNQRSSIKTISTELTINGVTKNITINESKQLLSDYFGVPQHIFRKVIFVPNDEVNWAIDNTNKGLKTNLDIIFGFEIYEKRKEDIKKAIKELINKKNREIEHESDYEQQEEKREQNYLDIGNLQEQLQNIKQEVEQLMENDKHFQQIIQEKQQIQDQINSIKSKITSKEGELKQLRENVHAVESEIPNKNYPNLNECTISKEKAIEDIQMIQNKIKENKHIEAQLKEDEEQCKNDMKIFSKEYNQLKQHYNDYNYAKQNLQELSDDFYNNYKTKAFIEFQDAKQNEVTQLQNELTKVQTEISDFKNENEILLKNLRNEKNMFSNELQQRKAHLNFIGKQINDLRDFNENGLKNSFNEYKQAENDLNQFKSSNETDEALNSKKQNIIIELNKTEEQLQILRIEKEIHKIQHNFLAEEEIINDNLNRIQMILQDPTIQKENIYKDIENKKRLNSMNKEELIREVTKYKQIIENDIIKENSNQQQLNEKRNKLGQLELMFKQLIDENKDLDNEIKFINNYISRLMQHKEEYTEFLKSAFSEHECRCPLCKRAFLNIAERDHFINDMNNELRNIPDQLKEAEEYQNNLENSRNEWISMKSLKSEIEDITKELDRLQISIRKNTQFYNEKNEELKYYEDNGNKLNECLSHANTIETELNKIKQHQSDFHEKECDLSKYDGQNLVNHSLQSTEDLIKNIQQMTQQKEKLMNEKQLIEDEIQNSIKKLNNLTNNLAEKERNYNNYQQNIEKKNNNIDEKQKLINEIEFFTSKENEKNSELQTAENRYQNQLNQLTIKEKNLSKNLTDESSILKDIQGKIQKMNELNDRINKFNNSSYKSDIDNLQQNIRNLQTTKSKNEKSLEEIRAKIDDLNIQLRNKEDEKRIIELHINYYTNIEKITKITQEIEEYNKQINSLGEITDLNDLIINRDKNKEEITKLKIQEGKLSEGKDIKEKEYKILSNIPQILTETRIAIETYNNAIDDLEKFGRFIDKALKAKHEEKMTELNNYLKHLWKETYASNDIEYISIKSILSDQKTTAYDYCVVMCKDGVELDMHHTASQGQKMLASLILRFAMVLVFAPNCRIIALDEPTTNLDEENKVKFAEALCKIIKSNHMNQWQVIVISHSEKFVNLIASNLEIDCIYHIEKRTDGKHSFSIIKRQERQ